MQQVQNQGGGLFSSPGGRLDGGRDHGGGRGNYFQQQLYNFNQGQPQQQQHTPNDSYANYLSEISYICSRLTAGNTLPQALQSGYQGNYYHQQPQFPRDGSRW